MATSTIPYAALPGACRPARCSNSLQKLKLIRPSFLDLRFSGDPWIEDGGNGICDLCLGDYRLASIRGMAFDLPALNRLLDTARHRRPRWQF